MKTKVWCIIQKKDDFEYKAGEIVDVSLWPRVLRMRYNKKCQKVIPALLCYNTPARKG